MALEHETSTRRIIGAAIQVHRTLGPGYVEAIYERALLVELAQRSIPAQRQVSVPIHYRGVAVGRHVLDLLVEDLVVVELKAVAQLLDVHCVTLRSYLTALQRDVGLLLNFAGPILEIKRVYRHYRAST